MVSSRVTVTISMKKTSAPIRSKELNLVSQYNPMKKAATRYALPKAITKADMISKGDGRPRFETTTVKIVSTNNPPPINQSCLAVAT